MTERPAAPCFDLSRRAGRPRRGGCGVTCGDDIGGGGRGNPQAGPPVPTDCATTARTRGSTPCRTKHVLPSWTVAHVVNALVVSSIRYCVAIYGSCNITQLNRIQKLLNFCARVISGRRKFQHISDVLQQLRWLPAVQLVKYHRLCLVKTALETSLPSDIAAMFSHVSTPYQTRQTGLLQNHRARTCSGTRMLAHCSSVFNQLPPDLRCLSGNAFKRSLKKLLLIEAWPDD